MRKDRCGHEKASGRFLILFLTEEGSQIFLLWPVFLCRIKVFSATRAMQNLSNMSNKTYFHVEMHKLQNFRRMCCRGSNICADYGLRGPITP